MNHRLTWWVIAVVSVVWSAPALAQEERVEFSVLVGWAFSEGVTGDSVVSGEGNVFDRIDPKNATKWGLDAGVLVTENAEVGFRFGQQRSTLLAGGTIKIAIGDMNVNTYHGYFAYNFTDEDNTVRPYLMAGLGATHFGAVDYTRRNGQTGTISGVTRFSTTWGAGMKVYPTRDVGVHFGAQWTPTYIKSDAVGWWCDPFWGCYVAANTQYSHQFDFSGGIVFRF